RYAIEPDIPFVNISKEIDEIIIDENLLPFSIESKMIGGGVRPQDAKFFTSDSVRSFLFIALNEQIKDTLFVAKTLLNNLKPEDYQLVDKPEILAAMFLALKEEKITTTLLQNAIKEFLTDTTFDYQTYFAAHSIS